ncbi:hypothetical protein Tco_0387543, partial [Tanacetum coccineum]
AVVETSRHEWSASFYKVASHDSIPVTHFTKRAIPKELMQSPEFNLFQVPEYWEHCA